MSEVRKKGNEGEKNTHEKGEKKKTPKCGTATGGENPNTPRKVPRENNPYFVRAGQTTQQGNMSLVHEG